MTATDATYLRHGWEPDTPSGDTLVLAGFRAMMERAERWARAADGRVQRLDRVVLADSGSTCPFVNEVLTTEPLTRELARRARAFYPDGQPFILCSPRGGEDLSAEGMTPVGHPPFMIRPPGARPPASVTPEHIAVTEVSDAEGLRTWADVVASGFSAPPVDPPAELLGGPHRFWLARRDGEPVACAAASVGHGVVDVEAVATLPGHRGRGLGEAVTWAATLADPRLPAVLLSSDLGRPVYERMGYLPVLRATMWMAG
jgi:GNAT superfamily N-acetyltransferase